MAIIVGVSIFAALGVYVWTIFGLHPLVIPEAKVYPTKQLRETRPWFITVHNSLSIVAFIGALLAGPLVALIIFGVTIDPGTGTWLAVSGWTIFNGLYELLTGICPAYGLLIKRHNRQYYLSGTGVKRLGLIRITLGVAIIGAVFIIYVFRG
ncbi:MAG: hypothetical protein AAF485_06435 [Chloroflexota bacterium]